MKNLFIAAGIVGGVAAGLIFYSKNRNQFSRLYHCATDAADDANHSLHKHLRKTERKINRELNGMMS